MYPHPGDKSEATVEFHLLGVVDFDRCVQLQHRLVYELGGRVDGQIQVLLCEHTPTISIGRGGSRGHIRLNGHELTSRKVDLRWVGRGGGCLPHAPGQLAIYPIVPLAWHGWSVGQYMARLKQALRHVVQELGFCASTSPGRFGVWGRTGQLAACGVAVRNDVTCHGAFLNVNPPMDMVRRVDVVPPRWAESVRSRSMGCLVAEHGRPVRMTKVRTVVVQQLAMALECPQYHMHTGHPYLASEQTSSREPRARAS